MKNNELFDYFISVQKNMNHKFAIACWGENSNDFVEHNLLNKKYSVCKLDSSFDFLSDGKELITRINELRKEHSNIAFVFSDIDSYSPLGIHEFSHATVGRNFSGINLHENDMIFYTGKNTHETNIPTPIINRSIHIQLTKD